MYLLHMLNYSAYPLANSYHMLLHSKYLCVFFFVNISMYFFLSFLSYVCMCVCVCFYMPTFVIITNKHVLKNCNDQSNQLWVYV